MCSTSHNAQQYSVTLRDRGMSVSVLVNDTLAHQWLTHWCSCCLNILSVSDAPVRGRNNKHTKSLQHRRPFDTKSTQANLPLTYACILDHNLIMSTPCSCRADSQHLNPLHYLKALAGFRAWLERGKNRVGQATLIFFVLVAHQLARSVVGLGQTDTRWSVKRYDESRIHLKAAGKLLRNFLWSRRVKS